MGAWGNKPFQSDHDLDWRGDFNDPVIERLKKSIKQTKYGTETRAAIEYLIRLDKGRLYLLLPGSPIFDLSLKRAVEIAEEFADPGGYDWWESTTDEEKAKVIKGHVDSVRKQIRYLKKLETQRRKIEDYSRHKSLSKAALEEAYEKLKKNKRDRSGTSERAAVFKDSLEKLKKKKRDRAGSPKR